MDISQNMHFDAVCLYLFIHAQQKAEESSVFMQSWRGCLCARTSDVSVCVSFRCVSVRALQMCVCVRACISDVCAGNFSQSARLLLQQSRLSFTLALCLWAVLISSPDTWAWTRMHALAVMHRRTLCENVDSAKIKVPSYKYRYFTHGIDASSYRHTLYRYIDPYRWIVIPLVNTVQKCTVLCNLRVVQKNLMSSCPLVSASDITPTDCWLNIRCIWHTFWKHFSSVEVVVGLVELYRISERRVCRVL